MTAAAEDGRRHSRVFTTSPLRRSSRKAFIKGIRGEVIFHRGWLQFKFMLEDNISSEEVNTKKNPTIMLVDTKWKIDSGGENVNV